MSDNNSSGGCGIGLGSIVAGVLSWLHWHSVWWLIPHVMFGWLYVMYHLFMWGFRTSF